MAKGSICIWLRAFVLKSSNIFYFLNKSCFSFSISYLLLLSTWIYVSISFLFLSLIRFENQFLSVHFQMFSFICPWYPVTAVCPCISSRSSLDHFWAFTFRPWWFRSKIMGGYLLCVLFKELLHLCLTGVKLSSAVH